MQQQELPFPTELTASQDELEERYHPVRYVAPEDKSYHFVIGVPKSWKIAQSSDTPPDQDEPVRTMLMIHAEHDAEIEIFCALLEREMHPVDWVRIVLESRGHTILKERRLPTDYGDAGDLLTEIEDEKGTIISRLFVMKDHNRLFIMHGRSRMKTYPDDADHFLCAMLSMRMLNPTSLVSAEPLKELHISKPMSCRFRIPQKWERKAAPASEGGVSFQLQDIDEDTVISSIQVTTLLPDGADGPSELRDQYVTQLRERDFKIDVESQAEREPPDGFRSAILYRLSGMKNDAEVAGQCAVFEHEEGWLVIASFGIGAESHQELWSIHDRAFEIVLQTLSASAR